MIKKYQNFREQLVGLIQTCGLDIGVVYFIMRDVMRDVDQTYFGMIDNEMREEQIKVEKEMEENNIENVKNVTVEPTE